MNSSQIKRILLVVSLLLIAGISYVIFAKKPEVVNITTFEECAKLYPVLESYPAQCKTPDGKSFTQNIGDEINLKDEVVVEVPRPDSVVSSPFPVVGKARGFWFFEGSFTAELLDAKTNKKLGEAVLSAKGEWMTEEFVPFDGKIVFTKPYSQKGILILKKDNPSGLPENDKEFKIPVRFE